MWWVRCIQQYIYIILFFLFLFEIYLCLHSGCWQTTANLPSAKEVSLHFLNFILMKTCSVFIWPLSFSIMLHPWRLIQLLHVLVACCFLLWNSIPIGDRLHWRFYPSSAAEHLNCIRIKLLWYQFSCGHLFSFCLGKYLGMEWLRFVWSFMFNPKLPNDFLMTGSFCTPTGNDVKI